MIKPRVHETTGRRVRNSLSRNEIVESGLNILESEGVDALTVRHLAKRLQCSVSALYSHFKSLEEIINAMIDVNERRLSRKLRQQQNFVRPVEHH